MVLLASLGFHFLTPEWAVLVYLLAVILVSLHRHAQNRIHKPHL